MAIYSYLESFSPSRIAAKSVIFFPFCPPSPRNLALGHKNHQLEGYRWLSRSNRRNYHSAYRILSTLSPSGRGRGRRSNLYVSFFLLLPFLCLTLGQRLITRPRSTVLSTGVRFGGCSLNGATQPIASGLISCRCENGLSLCRDEPTDTMEQRQISGPKSLPHFSLESRVEKGANGKRKLAR